MTLLELNNVRCSLREHHKTLQDTIEHGRQTTEQGREMAEHCGQGSTDGRTRCIDNVWLVF